MKAVILILTFLISINACAMSKKAPEAPQVVTPVVAPKPIETPAPPVTETPLVLQAKIAWEHPSYPERKEWSKQVFSLVLSDFATFDKASNAKLVCAKYNALNKAQKATVWTQFVAGIVRFESANNPVSRMKEPVSSFPKGDSVTGLAVYSEGLMQLSYQDVKGYPFCKLDWSKDKKLSATDPKKTILVPKINLDCGVGILAKQIARQGTAISPKSSGYWSVLREGGKYTRVKEILLITNSLPFCK